MIWGLVLWLFIDEVSDENYTSKINPRLNLKKLARFDLGVLLTSNRSHRRAIIPTLLYHIEYQFLTDTQVWRRLLNNFRQSPLVKTCVYYNIQKMTRCELLECIIILSVDDEVQYQTAKHFADKGLVRLTRGQCMHFIRRHWYKCHHLERCCVKCVDQFSSSFCRRTKWHTFFWMNQQ